jgi:hypothetical protein
MPESNLKEFEQYLLRAGVVAGRVTRFTNEIAEHLEDLQADAIAEGQSAAEAAATALQHIGDLRVIAEDIVNRPELKSWICRYPRAAVLILPITYFALLPATPLFAGVAMAPQIFRWGACLMLGAIVTAAMFLAMQLSIALG